MNYEIEKKLWEKCNICNKHIKDIKKEIGGSGEYFSSAFKKHLQIKHNIDLKTYFINEKKITLPKCKCGICNKEVDITTKSSKILIKEYACGRNEGVKKWSKKAKITRKGQGNPMFGKEPWNKGKNKHHDSSLLEVSKKLTGRVTKDETKLKQSISAKKRTKHGNTGNKHSEESKQKMREATLKRISRGDFKHLVTKPHKIFKKILQELRIDFKEEVVFGFFSVDFYLPRFNIYIEIDGDYFHCNPKIFPNGPVTKTQIINAANDKRKNTYFKNKNVKLVRFWEFDILNNKEEIQCSLKKLLT